MRSLGTLLALLIIAHFPHQDIPQVPPLAWGATIEELARRFTLVPAGGESGVRRFLCDVDSLLGAPIEECRLEFIAGELAGLAVTTRGEWNSRNLLNALRRRHGEGIREDSLSFQWMVGGTHISYDEDSAGDACVYWYRWNAPWQK